MPGDELRALFREIPSPVGVVTVEVSGEAAGLTVDSFGSLSIDPPLVGVALGRHAALLELIRESGAFAISVLASDQEHLAQHFARGVPPIALWQNVALRTADGPPQLDGAAAWLRCRLEQEHPTGDHTFFVSTVEHAEAGAARPLVYHGQAYAAL